MSATLTFASRPSIPPRPPMAAFRACAIPARSPRTDGARFDGDDGGLSAPGREDVEPAGSRAGGGGLIFMELIKVKLGGEIYFHRPSGKIVDVIAQDCRDGASLICESRDGHGDIFSDVFIRTEAAQLEPCTREQWETVYPPSDEENYSFDEMCKLNAEQEKFT